MRKLNAMLTPFAWSVYGVRKEGQAGRWRCANGVIGLRINLILDFEQER